jgi:hypothetical protein
VAFGRQVEMAAWTEFRQVGNEAKDGEKTSSTRSRLVVRHIGQP